MLLIFSFLASVLMVVFRLLMARPALTLAVFLGFALGSYATLREVPPSAPAASRTPAKAPSAAARPVKTSVPSIF
ncbi:hypothetical protein [Pyxidicoccus sp. MSG2]|uniref:hypothetical protein n=1 Tax=Pyxidicoccus sp. MSG2 TaxID=2996790 RepID=UPI00226E4AB6|nr:hypothetical protein [Pyxidicoccus sp. MSG2]MCY1023943.1 hypothetical protein [Pyxidicoccus sp. MSG2]